VRGLNLETLIEAVAEKLGLVPADVWSTGRQSMIARARGIICALAIEYLGISGREVSRQLHLSPSAVSKLMQRGRKGELTEKLSGTLFREHGQILHL
jgi:chromosomal replication initiation ATPase DnaA